MNRSFIKPDSTVDAVIAWVDGSDEAHRLKRERSLGEANENEVVEKLARVERRFSDNDEIRYCIRSIRNYAPWIRKIWLITDNQTPRSIDMALAGLSGVEVVDHRVIFRGRESMLPTFNSLAIETFMWRIPGIADRFIYFNDDMFLTRELSVTDFFDAGRPLLRGKWKDWSDSDDTTTTIHYQNRKQAAAMCGYEGRRLWISAHVCHPLVTSILEDAHARLSEAFDRNAAYRFRSREQFWSVALHDHLALATGEAVPYERPKRDWVFFSVRFCSRAEPNEVRAKLERIAQHKVALVCVNYMEAVVEKVPNAVEYLEAATGPSARFERTRAPSSDAVVS